MTLRRVAVDLAILLALAALALVVWVGRQRPPDPFLEAITTRGVLRVGTDPSYPPFEVAKEGAVVGYDADLSRALAAELGVRVEFVPLALDTMYDALAAGKADMLVSALPFIYERQKEVSYSVPYYQAGQIMIVRRGDIRITSAADLVGKRVGVELGSNADTEARRLARTSVPSMKLRSLYRSPQEALDALAVGDVDAAITDNTSAQSYMIAHGGKLIPVLPPLTDEPYVVAMPARATALRTRSKEIGSVASLCDSRASMRRATSARVGANERPSSTYGAITQRMPISRAARIAGSGRRHMSMTEVVPDSSSSP